MDCLYPHCTCTGKCRTGAAIPKRDPKVPLFDRAKLRELAGRYDLATTVDDFEFRQSAEDMKAIAFSLRFTAERL